MLVLLWHLREKGKFTTTQERYLLWRVYLHLSAHRISLAALVLCLRSYTLFVYPFSRCVSAKTISCCLFPFASLSNLDRILKTDGSGMIVSLFSSFLFSPLFLYQQQMTMWKSMKPLPTVTSMTDPGNQRQTRKSLLQEKKSLSFRPNLQN